MMSDQEISQRRAVLREAISWVGTRFHTRQAVKAVWRDGKIVDAGGVDCASLVAEVYRRAGMIAPVPIPQYPADWHMHRKTELFAGMVLERAREIEESAVRPADMVMYKFGLVFSHAAIVMGPAWPRIVHASRSAEVVRLDDGTQADLAGKPRRFFSLWGAA